MSTTLNTNILAAIRPSLSQIATRAMGAALLCSSLFTGCETPDNRHTIQDSLVLENISFEKDQLAGRYLTESTVAFHISRSNQDESEGLSITSSDPSLLRLTEIPESEPVITESETCFGAACDRAPGLPVHNGRYTQYFEVLAPGTVTLTFRDGDEVILKREVQLVEASSLQVIRDISTALPEGIDTTVGRGEKLVTGSNAIFRLTASLGEGEAAEAIDISTITELPSSESFTITQSDPALAEGVYLQLRPEVAGPISLSLQVGGQQIDLSFEAVSPDQIAGLTINHAQEGEYQDDTMEQPVPLGASVAISKDEAGEPIFGALVEWTRLDEAEQEELDTHYGDKLSYEYQEGARVPFKVTAGEHSEIVYLPMNPDSSITFAGDAITNGCDVQGGATRHLPLALMFLALAIIRRRQIA